MSNIYSSPVDKLLEYGDARGPGDWPDYLQLGLTTEHVPDLIRMATDKDLIWDDSDSVEVWAPIHAWRALGQLRAEAAIEPLLTLFDALDAEDWIIEEMPEVFGMIGPLAIPALTAYLADASHLIFSRVSAANCLVHIAEQHLETRAECVAVITRQLERFDENDPTLNGALVADLLDLEAVESAPAMERAFAAERVDLTIAGDWEDVQIELGLRSERETPRRNYLLEAMPELADLPKLLALRKDKREMQKVEAPLRRFKLKGNHKAKAKRRQAAKSRKKNRKRR